MSGRILTPGTHERACFNCSAWSPWDGITIVDDAGQILGRRPTGQCRANPPSIDPEAISGTTASWPVVEANDFCRGFEPAPHQHQPEPLPRPRRNNVA